MCTPIFQLDAFATRRFAGNPAAVIVERLFNQTRRQLKSSGLFNGLLQSTRALRERGRGQRFNSVYALLLGA
jgi:hypothetical protein